MCTSFEAYCRRAAPLARGAVVHGGDWISCAFGDIDSGPVHFVILSLSNLCVLKLFTFIPY